MKPSPGDPAKLKEPPATVRGARTRAALVQAARRVFERDGYVDSRLTDITAEARCSIGTFYTYFDGKDEIFTAVLLDAQADMMHPGGPRLEGDADPAEIIRASNRAYLQAYQRNARLMALMDQVAGIDENFADLRRERAQAFTERNARWIAKLQARGLADRSLDPKLAATALSSMVSRMAYNTWVLGDERPVDEITEIVTQIWINALRLGSGTGNPL